MKLAVMQPYFFPYLGYFQLIKAVDIFVIYDNVKFTKRGWFHRNRLVFNGKVDYFTINITKGSDYLHVVERNISSDYFNNEMPKILGKIEQNYRKAPYFKEVFPMLIEVFQFKEDNLFRYIYNSLRKTIHYLGIETKIIISSNIPIDHTLKNKWRLYEIANYLNINNYINPYGGKDLYDKAEFIEHGIELNFLKHQLLPYSQFSNEFAPGLSIIDVLMFNSKEKINILLEQYSLE